MGLAIMVVDDEIAICDNLQAYLEDEGLLVHTAYSGEEAVQRIADGLAVQACIMDLRLPGINGAEAILQIRSLAPAVRFVVHTGSANDAVIAELQRAGLGNTPVFKKPVADMSELARVVAGMCSAP